MTFYFNNEVIEQLIEDHSHCDIGDGLEAGCTLLQELRDLLRREPDGSPDESIGKSLTIPARVIRDVLTEFSAVLSNGYVSSECDAEAGDDCSCSSHQALRNAEKFIAVSVTSP